MGCFQGHVSRLVRKGVVARGLFSGGMPSNCGARLSSAEMKPRHEIL